MQPSIFSSVIFAMTAPWMLIVSMFSARTFRQQKLLGALFTAVLASLMDLGTGDGFRHQLMVEEYYAHLSFDAFSDELIQILTFRVTESGARDVYKHVLSFVVGGVLGVPKLFFPIVGFVYGYFFTGAMLLVLRHLRPRRSNYVVLAFVVVFFMLKGVVDFYTVRTWTGMWVLFYGCLRYFESRERRYLFLLVVPPFIHFAYFIMVLPAWAVVLLGNRRLAYAVLYVASSVTTFVPVDTATDAFSQTELGAKEMEAYRVSEAEAGAAGTERFAELQQKTNWYNAFRKAGLQRWGPALLVYIMLLTGVYLSRMNRFHSSVFSVGLLMLTVSNLTWFVYALHSRTLIVAMVFLVGGYILARLDPSTQGHFRGLPPYYRWGLHLSLLFFAPWTLFNLSVLADRVSVFMVGLPFLVWFNPEFNLAVKDLLRALLGG